MIITLIIIIIFGLTLKSDYHSPDIAICKDVIQKLIIYYNHASVTECLAEMANSRAHGAKSKLK